MKYEHFLIDNQTLKKKSYFQYAHFMANKVGSTSTDEAQILDQLVEDKPLPITTLVDDYDRFVYFFSQQFVYFKIVAV